MEDRESLYKILETTIMTSFVGMLAGMEKAFGEVWGHGKPEGELTAEELYGREIYKQLRKEVLDNANLQLKKLKAEFDRFDIKTRMFTYKLRIKEKE